MDGWREKEREKGKGAAGGVKVGRGGGLGRCVKAPFS